MRKGSGAGRSPSAIPATCPSGPPSTSRRWSGFVAYAMVNEVIRRVAGQSLQQVYDERIRIPYGPHLYLGLPEAEEERFRPVQRWTATPEQEAAFWSDVPGPHSLLGVRYGLNSTPPLDQVAFANTRTAHALGSPRVPGAGRGTRDLLCRAGSPAHALAASGRHAFQVSSRCR
ncbi:hypothetical protein DP939_39505 [Spongiactinospora rosea]|uniref:Beta-lactamase-related domain-containing protein n=1 Tax=Spongiactinospora rosea TaxID=2248750 RepID=A0A366LMG2_9ACTN|nr:serine hydrolase [Spongiactinospora rosea]RBQ14693.1 hypothetical protein DP939_39505 [Spongiactinospora rosea]